MRFEVISNSICPILNISSIGYSKDPAVTRFGAGVRNSYIIHYVISGKGYFNGNPVNAGQGFLITPKMHEHYYPDKKTPWEYLWVISNDERMADIFELFRADKSNYIFSYQYVSAVKDLAELLKKQANRIVNSFELLEMFLHLLKHQQIETEHHYEKTNAEIYIEAAVKYIQSNIHTAISVAQLTEFLGVSQPYLFKLFKTKFQMSAKEYILKQKLNQAKLLLKETPLTITHVANSVGFQDVLAFSRFFKSRTGLSPQKYRNTTIKKGLT